MKTKLTQTILVGSMLAAALTLAVPMATLGKPPVNAKFTAPENAVILVNRSNAFDFMART